MKQIEKKTTGKQTTRTNTEEKTKQLKNQQPNKKHAHKHRKTPAAKQRARTQIQKETMGQMGKQQPN